VNGFSLYVQEQLKSYVYLLVDPRNGELFYVGKGVGNASSRTPATHSTYLS
jgi:hypothetical protein